MRPQFRGDTACQCQVARDSNELASVTLLYAVVRFPLWT